ncbi:magnesium-translocating P-type ATPase [Sphingobium nicotianae]|uniref:Magnesium-transporting ATPase, P-type 1 n=1 Tax=Sphingobium nicotianae TaxID=2782607 RepID=A0A9X1ISE0_9SPHN|nr:magnesium-translocating P-type ATPase [Sphingobium nicotianae]MBT2188353.1 magnesium-translocating P-type ATPase [Sphingobium nicotianae]
MSSNAEFWQSPPSATLDRLSATPDGLSAHEAMARLARDGPNRLAIAPPRRLLSDLLRRLANPLVAILLVAATIAGMTGDLASFTIIVLVVILSTTLDLVQEHRAEATAEALKRSIALHANVLRDGAAVELPVSDLVAGDIVMLSAGDLIPADGIAIAVNGAQVNESLLTGEAYPVQKHVEPAATATIPAEARNALFHGTSLIGGTATMLVVETGARTRFGAIAASLARTQPPTAFERGIHKLGILIARLTVFLVLFVLLAHLALGRPPLQSFLFAMALAVGLTPELLPMIMTVSLARGAQRMASARVVVKRLSAIHDLGQMDILCTDKTGTLTEARITLVGHPGIDGEDDERVAELAAVNARFETGLKSPLDEALIVHATAERIAGWSKIDERPFDFERRRVSVLAERDGERIEIVKGAPEMLLALCTRAQDRSGALVPLDDGLRARLAALRDERAAQGLRLLGVAWKPAPGISRIGADGDEALIFAGYCVFVDPPKESAARAVARLEASGIRIKVISGDAAVVVEHLVAALALPVRGVLTGEQIETLSEPALAARVETVDLFARVTPDQKTRIVRALRARGHTVGFMGDGINDAPAIRAADVGLSVDGATDVAREAADMILLAPDLNVIADGVAEGRRTYANIMKYIRMGTSSNFGNMLTMALASLVLPFLPLTAVQVLLNNLIYDMSQIGIPFDTADPAEIARPLKWDMRELLRFTAIMGPLSSVFDLATFGLLLFLFHADVATFRAGWFIESMATQILVVFVIRTLRPAWSSRAHAALVTTASCGLAAALVLPFLPWAGLLGFAAPGAAIAGAILVLVLAYLASAELFKRVALPHASAS